MRPLATHVLLELQECDVLLLNDLSHVRLLLLDAARLISSQMVGEIFHQFQPQGVTGIIGIAESHISIHTWPEYGYAAVDIFTCGPVVQLERVEHSLIRGFVCRRPLVLVVKRGSLMGQQAVKTSG